MLANGEKMVSYRFEGYWKDVGTIESLWEANMDLLSPNSGLNLSDDSWKIYGRTTGSPPALHRKGREGTAYSAERGLRDRGQRFRVGPVLGRQGREERKRRILHSDAGRSR